MEISDQFEDKEAVRVQAVEDRTAITAQKGQKPLCRFLIKPKIVIFEVLKISQIPPKIHSKES